MSTPEKTWLESGVHVVDHYVETLYSLSPKASDENYAKREKVQHQRPRGERPS